MKNMKNVMYAMISLLLLLVIVAGSYEFIAWKHRQYIAHQEQIKVAKQQANDSNSNLPWDSNQSSIFTPQKQQPPKLMISNVHLVSDVNGLATVAGDVKNVGAGPAGTGSQMTTVIVTLYGANKKALGTSTAYIVGEIRPGEQHGFQTQVVLSSLSAKVVSVRAEIN